MADLLITEPEVRRAIGCLNPHNGAIPGGLFPMVPKPLSSHITPVLARMFNPSSKPPRPQRIGVTH